MRVLGFCVALALLGVVLGGGQKDDQTAASDEVSQASSAAVIEVSPDEKAEQLAAERQATEERVKLLSKQEETISSIRQANNQTEVLRRRLAMSVAPQWSRFVQTNMPAYRVALAEAKASPKGEAKCPVCTGGYYLDFCLLCTPQDISCKTCRGKGKVLGGEICPTCLGSKVCFMCGGVSGMLCPFCTAGIVSKNQSSNPPDISVYWEKQ